MSGCSARVKTMPRALSEQACAQQWGVWWMLMMNIDERAGTRETFHHLFLLFLLGRATDRHDMTEW